MGVHLRDVVVVHPLFFLIAPCLVSGRLEQLVIFVVILHSGKRLHVLKQPTDEFEHLVVDLGEEEADFGNADLLKAGAHVHDGDFVVRQHSPHHYQKSA